VAQAACGAQAACWCAPPDTALNYFFASVTPGALANGTGAASARFDGGGFGADDVAMRAGLKCDAALRGEELRSVVAWLHAEGKVGFFGDCR
jgi:hypothetical protein